jgi:hypothetical protein
LLTVKPEFKIDTTQLLDIIEGQSQILNISVTGNPNDITYTLYNNGVESTSSNIYVNNSVLIMVNISREDMGSYVLQAENNGGSTFHNFSVNVICKIMISLYQIFI